jgi:hypothetical protein
VQSNQFDWGAIKLHNEGHSDSNQTIVGSISHSTNPNPINAHTNSPTIFPVAPPTVFLTNQGLNSIQNLATPQTGPSQTNAPSNAAPTVFFGSGPPVPNAAPTVFFGSEQSPIQSGQITPEIRSTSRAPQQDSLARVLNISKSELPPAYVSAAVMPLNIDAGDRHRPASNQSVSPTSRKLGQVYNSAGIEHSRTKSIERFEPFGSDDHVISGFNNSENEMPDVANISEDTKFLASLKPSKTPDVYLQAMNGYALIPGASKNAPYVHIDLSTPARIGRFNLHKHSNFVQFISQVISRNHVEIFYDKAEKAFFLQDVGSHSGTWLNGTRLSESGIVSSAFEIRTGDTIRFGRDFIQDVQDVRDKCIIVRALCRTPENNGIADFKRRCNLP